MKRAFSLIELSIVVLIIGIIVAGVAQSSSLVRKMKLNTARSLTKSSPVAGIKNLAFWIETTSSESFDNSIDDGSLVAQWNDINPQAQIRNNITQNTTSIQPTYKSRGVNGLPAVSFSGGYLVGSGIPVSDNKFTFFVVYQSSSSGAWQCLFRNSKVVGSGLVNGFSFWRDLSGRRDVTFNDGQDRGGSAMTSSPEFVAVTYDGAGNINLYTNGSSSDEISGGNVMTATDSGTTLSVGAMGYAPTKILPFTGAISEIAVFDRVLTTEEIDSIEKYLGQKWGISLRP
jgi:prepilin-type N-terminal cleavage/methylation domain-containing protein